MYHNSSKTERDKLALAKLNASLKENQERVRWIAEFSGTVNKLTKMALESSKAERESAMKSQLTYKRQLIDAIDSIPLDQALELLNGAKTTYERYIIDAKIQRVNFSVAASILKDIIDPLLEEVKRKIETDILLQNSRRSKAADLKNDPAKPIIETEDAKPGSTKETGNSSATFQQIECDATKEQIIAFFNILAREKNKRNNEPYMSKEDVDLMIRMNFKIFGETPVQQYYSTNLYLDQKGMLAYFIFEFYHRYELNPNGNKMKYVNFLIRNFERFKNDDPKNLNKNMCVSKKPTRDIIQVDRNW